VEPDAGEIRIDGSLARITSAADAKARGIATIHQELALVPQLSVAENLLLGQLPRRFGVVDRRVLMHQAKELLDRVGARSAVAGFCFPPEVITLSVRWYLRFALSYRDVEELLVERGVQVDHVTAYWWVQWFTPLLAEAARPCRHGIVDRWQVDETYVRVAGRWRYVYRAVDQSGQVIDVFVSARRDAKAAHRFFERAIGITAIIPVEVVTDQAAAAYPGGAGRAAPGGLALHRAVRQQPRRGRPRPPQSAAASDARAPAGPQRQGRDRRARLCAEHPAGTLRTAVEAPVILRLAVALDELALAI